MGSMSTWNLYMKVFLVSAGVLFLGISIKKVYVPVNVNVNEIVPLIWSVILSWLRPPYLYIIINAIIITIAASSRFHHSTSTTTQSDQHSISIKNPPPTSDHFEPFSSVLISTFLDESNSPAAVRVVELKPVVRVNDSKSTEKEIELSKLEYNTSMQEIKSPVIHQLDNKNNNKPLVSSRFGHRKPNRTIPEVPGGRALRVARPKRQETLETTWKTITEGRHVPLTRHLKKSDTWERNAHHVPSAVTHMPKSETFNERTRYDSSLKIQKEPSLGQDDLNRRVEAFIRKVNNEMRLQREESLNQYVEMINRGV